MARLLLSSFTRLYLLSAEVPRNDNGIENESALEQTQADPRVHSNCPSDDIEVDPKG